MVLWRYESSRYASSSRIGYHPNHPSASRPSSRPSSAATVLRPFSASIAAPQQQQQQRASSALPSRSLLQQSADTHAARKNNSEARGAEGDKIVMSESVAPTMPSSGHLGGFSSRTGKNVPERDVSVSASEREATGGGSGSGSGSGRRDGGGHDEWDGANRGQGGGAGGSSRPLVEDEGLSLYQEAGDDIYEDLDDEDDGELDNRISILENRFSAVGRERPTSAVKTDRGGQQHHAMIIIDDDTYAERRDETPKTHAAVLSGRRPPRKSQPPLQQTSALGTTTTRHRRLASAEAGNGAARRTNSTHDLDDPSCSSSSACVEARALQQRLTRSSRPTSAPVNSSLFYQRGVSDPVAALDDRRMRLEMSLAGAGDYRATAVAREKKGGMGNVNPRPPVRGVATAILYWDRDTDGANRPTSCATDGTTTNNVEANVNDVAEIENSRSSRPSSAAFRAWVEARPIAKSAISAVSSARTLGMDDPELVHLQLEMESRRAAMSDAMLARMEDHYNAVVLKNTTTSPQSRQKQVADRTKPGRQTLPQTKGGGGGRDGVPTRGSRKEGASSASAIGGIRSRSKGKKKAGKGGVVGGKKNGATGRGRGGSSRGNKGKAKGPTTKNNAELVPPRRVYPSASAFMEKHFPSEERQGVSLLGMEQEEECRNASEALSRAGVSTISRGALRRALVIPTDRSLEACLASLAEPTGDLLG
ncbi:unnamed protein product [Laminaria digitata]